MVLQPGLVSAGYSRLHHIVLVAVVVHTPLEEDKVPVVAEVAKLQVAAAEFHMVPSARRHLLDQAEMAQTRLAFELSDQHMELRSVDIAFHQEPMLLHNSDRFDIDYS